MARGKDEKEIKLKIDAKGSATTLKELRADARKLKAVLANINPDDKGKIKKYKAELDKVEKATRKVGEETGLVKKRIGQAAKETTAWQRATSKLGGIMKTAFAATGILFLIDKGTELVMGLGQIGKEAQEVRRQIAVLTGVSGDELDKLTAKTMTVADAMGEDYAKVIQANNVAIQKFGENGEVALDKIQKAALLAVDPNNELLDVITEYSPKVAEAGLSFDGFLATLIRSERAGAKNLDTVADFYQEFGQRIREQTKATSDALAPLGTSFRDELFVEINNGSIDANEALGRVVKRMNGMELATNQVQTIIADVFGSQGEELTIDFIRNLDNVQGSFDDLVNSADEYTLAQLRIQEAQEKFNLIVTKVADSVSSFFAELLVKSDPIINVFTDLWKEVETLYNQFVNILRSMGLFKDQSSAVETVVNLLAGALTLVTTPLKLILRLINAITNAGISLYNRFEFLRGFLGGFSASVLSVFTDLKEGIVNTFSSVGDLFEGIFNLDPGKIKESLTKLDNQFKGSLKRLGENAASAYIDGYYNSINNQIKPIGTGTSSVSTSNTSTDSISGNALGGAAPASPVVSQKVAEVEQLKKLDAVILGDRVKHIQDMASLTEASITKEQEMREKSLESIKQFNEAKINTEKEVLQHAANTTEDIANFLLEDEENRKKHAGAIKAFQIANVKIKLISEVQAIWEKANENPLNALIPGSAAVIAGAKTALAIARSNQAVSAIQNQQFGGGGELYGPSHARGGIKGWGGFGNLEAEGGEFMINKYAYANNRAIVNRINKAGKFSRFGLISLETGGALPTPSDAAIAALGTSQQNNQSNQLSEELLMEIRRLRADINSFEREKEIYIPAQKIEDTLSKRAKIRNY